MERGSEHLGRHVLVHLGIPGLRTEVESKPRTHASSPTSTLLEVSLGGPDGGIVGHVVVRGEELHLGLAGVDHEDDVVDRDGGLGDVGRQDDLGHAVRDVAKHLPLVLPWQLGVERDDAIPWTPENTVLLQPLHEGEDHVPSGQKDQDGSRDL